MKLNELRDNPGARKVSKRVGRGIGSGKGKTAGSGHKGQKARSGVSIKGFEGGQMPLYQRLPKRGFTNIFRKVIAEVNLGDLQKAIDEKKLDDKKKITRAELVASGLVRKNIDLIKLLGRGELKSSIDLEVNAVSENAQKAIEKAKGKVTLITKKEISITQQSKSSEAEKKAKKGAKKEETIEE